MSDSQFLQKLADRAIERLRQMPQPVVRICGPLTSGGAGYEENLERFATATRVLTERGYTVFDYFEDDDEEHIKEAGLPWEDVMEQYHKPILQSGLLQTAFFLPGWEQSNGAKWEHDYISAHTDMEIKEFPLEWLDEHHT